MSRPQVVTRRSAKSEYIETDTGNKISRRARIEGKQSIMLAGKSVVMAGAILRGDLHRKSDRPAEGEKGGPITAINIGRYAHPSSVDLVGYIYVLNVVCSASVISTDCTIRPPMRMSRGQMTFYPMRIGDNVFIGTGTHVSALSISSHVHVGANCVLSPFCVIKESCKILPDTVVPPHMVIPPGSIVAGRPARVVDEVGEGWGQGGGGEGEEYVEGGDLRALVRSIK
ncbi:hypothetical protein LTR12_004793 [Friedmanniomyces endolithicus]|nr:hypothetical protein LTR74_011306 [Friedmanniomyces endolithicus]KAK1820767.1 hypothetical protein LTR12_004793 [Friedmanniomyces endolithicus]